MATLTINTPPDLDARIKRTFGIHLDFRDIDGNFRDATGPEIKEHMINYMKSVVLGRESKELKAAVVLDPFEPT
jgi:hypothetical protein